MASHAVGISLSDAFGILEPKLNVSVTQLMDYAAEDHVGGYPEHWPVGSMFANEGKILYATIRALRPRRVVEFGVRYGCSSKHILSALVMNGFGTLRSYDVAPIVIKERFTEDELYRWILKIGDASVAELPKLRADIVFEDTDHSAELTETLIRRGMTLNPLIILAHDGLHPTVGKDVRDGFNKAIGQECDAFRTEDSDCGFIYWFGE